ncbi:MAG TPA: calcium-binding EGF-like domain-containing protein [Myxococcota bacterium]|nr:calcium-binding EGF-like domain-containing protein [Myxococcota bacterium]
MRCIAFKSFWVSCLIPAALALAGCGAGNIGSPADGGGDGGAANCESSADCDDGNPCTADSCTDAICTNENIAASCDDGDACTENDVCSAGACTGTAISCDDGNDCTNDSCDSLTGCVFANNTAACDDGDACTSGDACSSGACQAGPATDCNDGNSCTDDSCDSLTGCAHADNTLACNDGDACTENDVCSAGACSGSSIFCDDGKVCTDDSCDSLTGCVYANNTASCDDGDACTSGDACSSGACQAGPATDCDDGNSCTDDSCDSLTGCAHADNTLACDDGDACTSGDTCSGGVCQAGTATDCDDGKVCTDDSCDSLSGCVFANNAAACNDGDACTSGDACSGGTCQAGQAIDCSDGSDCTADSCDSLTGCANTNLCAADASCVGNACQCDAGFTGDGHSCSDIDECAQGSDLCDSNAGCTNTAGSYTCACNSGWTGDGFTCVPEQVCDNGICGQGEDFQSCPQDCDFDIAVVVEDALSANLTASLGVYQDDLAAAGYKVRIENWTGGTVGDLKTLLYDQVDSYGIEGALLVGNLPAAWYEQTAFDTFEQFPCDLYLEDRNASWSDADSNGRYDAHTDLNLVIYVSRLTGSATQLNDYFAKNHAYRTTGSLVDAAAYNFIDDDWQPWAGTYGLEAIYTVVDVLSDLAQTTRAAYIAKMTGTGAEFVYQWIHSSPTTLYVSGTGSGTISTAEIASNNFIGSFYNMFDCSACRFTQENLGMTYLTRTDYGLATIGSTKTGGIYTPWTFHSRLAAGDCWGESFRQWYNGTGKWDDEWYLGIVILGDPLLTIQGDRRGLILEQTPAEPTRAQLESLRKSMHWDAVNTRDELGTYEAYRASNPQFFVR